MSNYDTKNLVALHPESMSSLDIMVKARTQLMSSSVGIATMLLHLELIEDNSFDTMATDGKTIVFNSDFVRSLPMDEIKAVMIHEAMHVVWEHHLRQGERHSKLWNIATDYAINNYIRYKLKMQLPEGGLWNMDFDNWSAEKIYQELFNDDEQLEDAISQLPQQSNDEESGDDQSSGGSSDDSSDDSSDSSDDGSSDVDAANITGYSSAQASALNASGSICLDDLPETVGQVMPMKDEQGNELSDTAMNEEVIKLRQQVMMADRVQKMQGSGTSVDWSDGRVGELQTVKVDWENQLRDFLTNTMSEETTWARPNKRVRHLGITLPSKKKTPQGGTFACMYDVSGSVSSEERDQATTETISIANDLGVNKIMSCRFAHTVFKNEEGEHWDIHNLDEGDELADMKDLRLFGGGGTSFDPPFNLFNEHTEDADEVDAILFFTDGYGDVSEEVDPCIPVVWVVSEKERYSSFNPPFGEVIYMDT